MKIILHGSLKKLWDKPIEISANTVAEAVNGMCKMTKAFNVKMGQQRHILAIKGYNTKESLYEPIPEDLEELHIFPAFVGLGGARKGAFIQIVIGIVLIAVAIINPAFLALSKTAISVLSSTGIGMIAGGLIGMLQKQPRIDTGGVQGGEVESSKYLGSNQNTVRIGTRIPIIYGRAKAGGHYISFDVDASDFTTVDFSGGG